jgi:Uma2 family endonuclease
MTIATATPAQLDEIYSAHVRFLLYDVDWRFYESILKKVEDRHVFVTYNKGSLELMSPSWEHDKSAEILGLIIRLLAEAQELPVTGGASTTFRRKDLEAALEPDRCFYIKNEHRIRGKKRIDLRRDPPSDLAIEIKISRRLLDRESIYAALGVPELWRYDRKSLRVSSNFIAGNIDKWIEARRSHWFHCSESNRSSKRVM